MLRTLALSREGHLLALGFMTVVALALPFLTGGSIQRRVRRLCLRAELRLELTRF